MTVQNNLSQPVAKANIYETLKINVMKYTGIKEMNTEVSKSE